MASDLDRIEKLFCGKWKYKEDIKLAECLKNMNYKEDVAKFVMESKPTMSLKRDGDTFTMVYELRPGAAQTHVFKLGEYFEAKDDTMDPPLYHNKDICTWEADDTLKFVSTSLLTGENKVDTETNFKIVGENLHNLMNKLGDKSVIGNRVMVKVKDS